jgi:hypothetical protein
MLLHHAHRHTRHATDAAGRLIVHAFVLGLAALVTAVTLLA